MTKVKNEDTRFLETITGFGDNILLPINRIKFISIGYKEHGWQIKIVSDEEGESIEYFEKDNDRLNIRYEQIKEILKGK